MKKFWELPPGPEREAAKADYEPPAPKGSATLRYTDDGIFANGYRYPFASEDEKRVARIFARAGAPPIPPGTTIERDGAEYALTFNGNKVFVTRDENIFITRAASAILRTNNAKN